MSTSPEERADLLNPKRTDQGLINVLGAAEQAGFKIALTSLRGDHHDDGPRGHAGGRAADVGTINGVTAGFNRQTWDFVVAMIQRGVRQVGVPDDRIAKNPDLQALARQHNVYLFKDNPAHVHVGV